MSEQNELEALMRAAQAGDGDAYSALLQAIAPMVRRQVSRQRGFAGREAVEDLVQDVLLSVHKSRATYDPGRPFVPWLRAIVRYRLADGARRYGRHEALETPLEDEDDVTLSGSTGNSQAGFLEDVDDLHAALRSLPPGQRRAIELLKLREMSLKEAATATGTSVGALKVASHRGLSALRRALRRSRPHED